MGAWWEDLSNATGDESPPSPTPPAVMPVIGFRAFRLASHDTLTSYSHSEFEWEKGANTSAPCSQCIRTFRFKVEKIQHTEPDGSTWEEVTQRRIEGVWPNFPSCRCGFWAAHSIEELIKQEYGRSDSRCVIGGIIGWGRIQVGELLFRAQYAKIIALTDGIPMKPVIHKTRVLGWQHAVHPQGAVDPYALAYGVPIVPLNRLVNQMKEWGNPAV